MKEFKKKLAVILAFCMVLTSTVPAFAATIQEETETEISAQTEDNALLENDEYEEASHSNAKYEDNILTDEEDIEEVIIEENFEDVALIDDTEGVLPAEDEEAEFFAEVKVGNVIITAKAEAGVVPKGTILKAKKVVDKEVKEAIDEVVEEKREDEAQVVESLKFDIKLIKDDEEIEPDGLVSLSFALADAAANADVNVYHILEDEDTKELVEAEVLEVEKVEEPEEETPLVLETEVPGFSYYVVEFTVGELQYVLEGDSSVKLSEILAELKIEGTVTKAVSGAPELFSVEKDATGDDWTVTALKAFSSTEKMTVTMDDGKGYEIIVTDEQTYTVEFYPAGGTGNMDPQNMTYGVPANLNSNTFTSPDGKKFAGWAEDSTAAKPKYADREVVMNLAGAPGTTVTLYAVWVGGSDHTVVRYLIDKDSYGHGTITNNIDIWQPSGYDGPKGSTATAKEGYEFAGWKDASGNPVTDNTDVGVSDDGKTITPAQTSTKDTYYTALFKKQKTIAEILPEDFPATEADGWKNDKNTKAYLSSEVLNIGGCCLPLDKGLTSFSDYHTCTHEFEEESITFVFKMSDGKLQSIEVIGGTSPKHDQLNGEYKPAPLTEAGIRYSGFDFTDFELKDLAPNNTSYQANVSQIILKKNETNSYKYSNGRWSLPDGIEINVNDIDLTKVDHAYIDVLCTNGKPIFADVNTVKANDTSLTSKSHDPLNAPGYHIDSVGVELHIYIDFEYVAVLPTLSIDTAKTEYKIGEVIRLTINVEGISGSTTVDITDGTNVWKLDTNSDGKAILSDATKTAAGTYTYTVTLPQFDGVSALIYITVKKPASQKTVGDILDTVDDFPTTKETGWENANGIKAYKSSKSLNIGGCSLPFDKGLTSGSNYYTCTHEFEGESITFVFMMSGDKLQSIEVIKGASPTHDQLYGEYKPAPLTSKKIVTFIYRNGQENHIVEVPHNGKVSKPSVPKMEGYTFDVWCSDAECKIEYDFNTPVIDNLPLYARWKKDAGTEGNVRTEDKVVEIIVQTENPEEIELIADIKKNTSGSVASADSLADAVKNKVKEEATKNGKDVILFIDTKLTGIKVKKEQAGETGKATITLTYDATPWMSAIGSDGKVEETRKISNSDLNGNITLRLPVPASITEKYVNIVHESDGYPKKTYKNLEIVNQRTDNAYVEIKISHFSSFELTFSNEKSIDPVPYNGNSGSGSTSELFTGRPGKPVTNGRWTQNADGTWSYATSRKFTSTWGCIANPNDANSAAWYYFDRNGNMLTGWQKLYWNGAYKWYFFSQTKDANEGKCQLGGITPDGYKVGPDGAWIED